MVKILDVGIGQYLGTSRSDDRCATVGQTKRRSLCRGYTPSPTSRPNRQHLSNARMERYVTFLKDHKQTSISMHSSVSNCEFGPGLVASVTEEAVACSSQIVARTSYSLAAQYADRYQGIDRYLCAIDSQFRPWCTCTLFNESELIRSKEEAP